MNQWIISFITQLVGWRVVIAFRDHDEHDRPFAHVTIVDVVALVTYENGESQWMFVMPNETVPMTERDISEAFSTVVNIERVLGPSHTLDDGELQRIRKMYNVGSNDERHA